jgi:hypothetical protein
VSFNSRPLLLFSMLAYLLALAGLYRAGGQPAVGPKGPCCWQVEDVRAGMKGEGRTVMKGTKVETFQAEVLGVLRNTSPGRDLVLCRLSGLNLDKTGVIAGMSGSPVYLDGKLLGAVAYAWAYGKEPIAGVTPFCQMQDFAVDFDKPGPPAAAKPTRVGLAQPLRAGGRDFDAVTVAQDFGNPAADDEKGLWLVPLRTPLAATGLTPHSLRLLRDRVGDLGLVPVQGGGAGARVLAEEKDTPLEPGGPLALALITGDFDLSGIGTVTHIEGGRVYGWGHPFMGLGACEFPLMTGFIHTIYPRQTVSFKMGSPLREVGVINSDASTGVAGRVGPKADLLPVKMSVALGADGAAKAFNVQVARQRSLVAALVLTALTNSVDMEGELPEELTAEMEARVEVAGRPPLVIKDTFSGFSGGRAPQALYGPVASVVNQLAYSPHQPLRVERVECRTRIVPGRRAAEIEAAELDADAYAPGDTVRATAFVRPFKGQRRRVTVSLKLPEDLPEGSYSATLCDDAANARGTLRDAPTLNNPTNATQLLEALRTQTAVQRTHLVLRVPTGPCGVADDGKALPDLPASMVHILTNGRRTGAQTVSAALVARQPTDWVIQGSETVHFRVVPHKKTTRGE